MCDTVFTVSYEQCILFRDSGEPKTAERNCEGKLFKNEANTFSVKDEDLLDVITVSACVCKKKTKKKKYPNKNSVHITGKMLALKYHSTAEFLILLARIVDEISLRAVPAPITSLYLTCLF